ncbi:helix-turn-helix transcriptional regulator [Paraburkholderia mimosarum]|uniref:helix-turn-helix transcriptional regulator n=1 Tax=Paraburkholderia mimosarum TaxID=312026 RepID=UPI00041D7727|nr:AraC family transcriptional regulator [Paraburkholderia mimosarum]
MNEKIDADSGQHAPDRALAGRFRLRQAPTLRASVAPLAPPVTFSRLRNDRPQPGRSLPPPPEEAVIFQIPLVACPEPDICYSGIRIDDSAACRQGWSYLLDLRCEPTRRLDKPFDAVRLYLSRSTIDDFTWQKGRRRIGDLVQREFGVYDPVLFHLTQAVLPVLEQPALATSLFLDYVGLAFCEHVVTRYGQADAPSRQRRAMLAPWQMRRITEFVESHPGVNPSILDLAGQCDLSASYFAEAFKQTTGMSPHQWLLKRRIERAKSKLRDTDASLASIALDCGFFDQSHFSRVFTRYAGCGPKDWRAHHRSR